MPNKWGIDGTLIYLIGNPCTRVRCRKVSMVVSICIASHISQSRLLIQEKKTLSQRDVLRKFHKLSSSLHIR